eukprot:scaffold25133_cov21-Tisochrysis_lutea.AAC.1
MAAAAAAAAPTIAAAGTAGSSSNSPVLTTQASPALACGYKLGLVHSNSQLRRERALVAAAIVMFAVIVFCIINLFYALLCIAARACFCCNERPCQCWAKQHRRRLQRAAFVLAGQQQCAQVSNVHNVNVINGRVGKRTLLRGV